MTSRTLNHGDLVDLKQAAERGLRQVPEVLLARRIDAADHLLDALGTISDAFAFVLSHLGLEDLDDEDPDEFDPSDPQKTTVANWSGNRVTSVQPTPGDR